MISLNIKKDYTNLILTTNLYRHIYKIEQYWSGEVPFEANSHMPFPI
jgi:hypothetical protein